MHCQNEKNGSTANLVHTKPSDIFNLTNYSSILMDSTKSLPTQ